MSGDRNSNQIAYWNNNPFFRCTNVQQSSGGNYYNFASATSTGNGCATAKQSIDGKKYEKIFINSKD